MNNKLPFRPLFGLQRGDVLEVEVYGFYAASKGEQSLTVVNDVLIPSRSLLKPWQLACCIETLDDNHYWAMGMSSSSGEEEHLEALTVLSHQTGISTDSLICPTAYSYHPATRAKQIAHNEKPQKIYHFCCGNHLLMKHACAQYGFDSATYFEQDNPIQLKLSALLHEQMGVQPRWAIDSCGIPTLIAPVSAFMRLWQHLSEPCGKRWDAVKKLWIENPMLIGGSDRVDTIAMVAGKGRVLAKEGADGLLAIQTLEVNPQNNVTLLIKLAQGVSDNYLAITLYCVLEKHYDVLPESLHAVLQTLKSRVDASLMRGQILQNLTINQF